LLSLQTSIQVGCSGSLNCVILFVLLTVASEIGFRLEHFMIC
jgi:hypothetical protein